MSELVSVSVLFVVCMCACVCERERVTCLCAFVCACLLVLTRKNMNAIQYAKDCNVIDQSPTCDTKSVRADAVLELSTSSACETAAVRVLRLMRASYP